MPSFNIRRYKKKFKISNPFNGAMAEGYDAFHSGVPRNNNRYGAYANRYDRAYKWDLGWIKAKLAKEQEKQSL